MEREWWTLTANYPRWDKVKERRSRCLLYLSLLTKQCVCLQIIVFVAHDRSRWLDCSGTFSTPEFDFLPHSADALPHGVVHAITCLRVHDLDIDMETLYRIRFYGWALS